MYPPCLHHRADTTRYTAVGLPSGGPSHPTIAWDLSKALLHFGEWDLMPVQGDACRHLGTKLDVFSKEKESNS